MDGFGRMGFHWEKEEEGMRLVYVIIILILTCAVQPSVAQRPIISGEKRVEITEFNEALISWTITDDNPKSYFIILSTDGFSKVISKGEWQKSDGSQETEVSIRVSLAVGEYSITIQVEDYDGEIESMKTEVIVTENTDITPNLLIFGNWWIVGIIVTSVIIKFKRSPRADTFNYVG